MGSVLVTEEKITLEGSQMMSQGSLGHSQIIELAGINQALKVEEQPTNKKKDSLETIFF